MHAQKYPFVIKSVNIELLNIANRTFDVYFSKISFVFFNLLAIFGKCSNFRVIQKEFNKRFYRF